jgi:hypothetical protein
MWQEMHWLEGMLRVNWCLIGCAFSRFEIIGSAVKLRPWLPYLDHQPELVGDLSLA